MLFSNGMLLLLGGLLVGVPVVLHFAMQPRPKPLPFPALQFLKETHSVSSRQLRLKHVLLLIARCLVVAIPALALAGPAVAENAMASWVASGLSGLLTLVLGGFAAAAILRRNRGWMLPAILGLLCMASLGWFGVNLFSALNPGDSRVFGNPEEPVSAVLVVDTSPRMGYRRDNQTHLEFAKDEGNWILSQLPPDSQISVIDTADMEPFFSVDLGSARRRLQALEIGFSQSPLPDAIRTARKLLETAGYRRREIYIVTDLSVAAWSGSGGLPDKTGDPETPLFVFDVGTTHLVNLRLNNLNPESVQLSSRSSLAIETSLNCLGGGGERVVEMKIEQPDPTVPRIRDGKTLTPEKFWNVQQTFEIPDNGSANVGLRFEQALPPGVHHGTISVYGSDGLELDNKRFFTIEVDHSWRVLVLYGPGVNPVNLTKTLNPEGYESYLIDESLQSEIGTVDLGQYNSVILLDPAPLPSNEWERILRFAENGGGVGVFLGANAISNSSGVEPSFLSEPAQTVLGGELTVAWDRSKAGQNIFLAPDDLSHPVFSNIRPVKSALSWSKIPVRIFWGIETGFGPATPGQIVLRYSNGQPAIVERMIGQGRSLVMTTPITDSDRPEGGRTSWNSLFLGNEVFPAFALVRGMGQHLVQARSESLNVFTNQPVVLRNDVRVHPDSYTIFTPNEKRPPAPLAATRGELRYSFTPVPGQYRLKGLIDGAPVIRGFSVNVDDAATDLTRIEPKQLDEILGPGNYKLANDQDEFERQQGTSRRGQEFYPMLLIVLGAVLAVESLLSNRFYGNTAAPVAK